MSYRKPTTCQAITYTGKYLSNGLNQSKAFRDTFPKSKASAKTIHEYASRFHHSAEVQYHIWRIRMILQGKLPRGYGL